MCPHVTFPPLKSLPVLHIICTGCLSNEHFSIKNLILGSFVIRHYGGLCIEVEETSQRLVLSLTCGDKFKFIGRRHLQHIYSHKCVVPVNTSQQIELTLSDNCSTSQSVFQYKRSGHLITNMQSNDCIQSENGKVYPTTGAKLVLATCEEYSHMEFRLVNDGMLNLLSINWLFYETLVSSKQVWKAVVTFIRLTYAIPDKPTSSLR